MRIYLTKESADALCRVESLNVWEVLPTMVRGRPPRSPRKRKWGRRSKGQKKRRKEEIVEVESQKTKKVKKVKKKGKAKKSKEPIAIEDPCPELYRRNAKGIALIRQELRALRGLDEKAFPQNPIFHMSGSCRMKYAPASETTFDMILEHAPAFMEATPLGSTGTDFCKETAYSKCLQTTSNYHEHP